MILGTGGVGEKGVLKGFKGKKRGGKCQRNQNRKGGRQSLGRKGSWVEMGFGRRVKGERKGRRISVEGKQKGRKASMGRKGRRGRSHGSGADSLSVPASSVISWNIEL